MVGILFFKLQSVKQLLLLRWSCETLEDLECFSLQRQAEFFQELETQLVAYPQRPVKKLPPGLTHPLFPPVSTLPPYDLVPTLNLYFFRLAGGQFRRQWLGRSSSLRTKPCYDCMDDRNSRRFMDGTASLEKRSRMDRDCVLQIQTSLAQLIYSLATVLRRLIK